MCRARWQVSMTGSDSSFAPGAERAGLTQEELALRAGLTPHAISALERGTRTHPYPHTVRSLADALDLSQAERSALIHSIPRRRPTASPSAPTDAPATTSADRMRGRARVVVPSHPLYGRDGDVAEVVHLARSGSARLITLTGPGGVGKTRLAMAVADELAGDYPDGVTVHCAGVVGGRPASDGDHRAGAASSRAVMVPTPPSLVTDQLARSRLLLVLDNFEHLLSAAPEVGHLVSSCPTSHGAGHQPFPAARPGRTRVCGDTADAAEGRTSGQPTRWPSRRRAPSCCTVRSRSPPPRPSTEDDARALAELCHRLAGLPLAIELATAHLRLLTPAGTAATPGPPLAPECP